MVMMAHTQKLQISKFDILELPLNLSYKEDIFKSDL